MVTGLLALSCAQRLTEQGSFNVSGEVLDLLPQNSTNETPITTSESSSQQPPVNTTIGSSTPIIPTTTRAHITTMKPTNKPNNACATGASLILVASSLLIRTL